VTDTNEPNERLTPQRAVRLLRVMVSDLEDIVRESHDDTVRPFHDDRIVRVASCAAMIGDLLIDTIGRQEKHREAIATMARSTVKISEAMGKALDAVAQELGWQWEEGERVDG
jgi:hypothetical protein